MRTRRNIGVERVCWCFSFVYVCVRGWVRVVFVERCTRGRENQREHFVRSPLCVFSLCKRRLGTPRQASKVNIFGGVGGDYALNSVCEMVRELVERVSSV